MAFIGNVEQSVSLFLFRDFDKVSASLEPAQVCRGVLLKNVCPARSGDQLFQVDLKCCLSWAPLEDDVHLWQCRLGLSKGVLFFLVRCGVSWHDPCFPLLSACAIFSESDDIGPQMQWRSATNLMTPHHTSRLHNKSVLIPFHHVPQADPEAFQPIFSLHYDSGPIYSDSLFENLYLTKKPNFLKCYILELCTNI